MVKFLSKSVEDLDAVKSNGSCVSFLQDGQTMYETCTVQIGRKKVFISKSGLIKSNLHLKLIMLCKLYLGAKCPALKL